MLNISDIQRMKRSVSDFLEVLLYYYRSCCCSTAVVVRSVQVYTARSPSASPPAILEVWAT